MSIKSKELKQEPTTMYFLIENYRIKWIYLLLTW